jgi:hypothetical protein
MIDAGVAVFFGPALLICLLGDAQRGWLRVLCPLPVTVRRQAASLWFIGVFLAPLLLLPAVALGTWLAGSSAHNPSPWFYSAVQWWVGLGYGAFVYLLCTALPTRPAATPWETLAGMVVGACWGISIPGSMFLGRWLPKSPSEVTLGHEMLFASVPLWLIASAVAAPLMASRRLSGMGARAASLPAASAQSCAAERGKTSGLLLLVRNQIARHVLLLVGLVSVQAVVFQWMTGGKAGMFTAMGSQTPMYVLIFSAMSQEMLNLRSLRMLPISVLRLAVVLLIVPLVLSSGISLLIAAFSQMPVKAGGISQRLGDPGFSFAWNFIAFATGLMGFSSLLLVAMMHIQSGWRIGVLMLATMISSVGFVFGSTSLNWFFSMGLVMLVTAFAWLVHGLRRSSTIYRPRQPLMGWNNQAGGLQR